VEILITGGNGFLGRHLVAALQARGDVVRVLALPCEDAGWLEARGVTVYRGDICDARSLLEPMRGAEGVFHLAAMVGVWGTMQEYSAVNVGGTENVCRASLATGVRRLVHVSGAIVYDMAVGWPVRESDPLSPLDEPYSVTKAQGDLLVQRLIRDEGLPAVVIRPGTMFGTGDRLNFGRIADRLRGGKGPIIGSGRNAVPFVSIDDIVQGLLLALDDPRAAGQVYNIGNDQRLTQGELLRAIAEDIGVPPPRLHVPYPLLYAVGLLAERLAEASGNRIRPIVTRHGVKLYGADNRISIDKARRELGYEPGSLRESLRRAAAWYVRECGSRMLDGEVAIVTGASSGIGAATARALALRGARVVLAARRASELEAQARAIREAGGDAIAVPTDIGDAAEVARLVEGARAAFGRIDVLVNNAGANWTAPLSSTPAEEISRLLRVNLVGAMMLTRAVLPEMLERRHGAIVSVGSVQGRLGIEPLYSATKFGLRGFSLALRRQITGSGVSVSLVMPGNIRTAMTSHLQEEMPGPELIGRTIADLVERPRREVILPSKYRALVALDQWLPALADFAFQMRHRNDPRPVAYGEPATVEAHALAVRE
jgi:nucleoside-diphosphate-sugar epimerase